MIYMSRCSTLCEWEIVWFQFYHENMLLTERQLLLGWFGSVAAWERDHTHQEVLNTLWKDSFNLEKAAVSQKVNRRSSSIYTQFQI